MVKVKARKQYKTIDQIEQEKGKSFSEIFLPILNRTGNVNKAAEKLSVSPRNAYRYVEKHFCKVTRWEYKPGIVVVDKTKE